MWSRRLMRSGSTFVVAATVAAFASTVAIEEIAAQTAGDTSGLRGGRVGGGGGGRGGNRQPGPFEGASPEMFQKFIEGMLRNRVMMNDEQITKWKAWNKRFDPERNTLWREEGAARRQLRALLDKGATPDDVKAADILKRLSSVERKWVDVHERENRELEAFLPQPMQRLRFYAFQDFVKREFQEMQNRREGRGGDMRNGDSRSNDGRGGPPQFRRDSTDKFRQKGDTAGMKYPRGQRPPGKVDTMLATIPQKDSTLTQK